MIKRRVIYIFIFIFMLGIISMCVSFFVYSYNNAISGIICGIGTGLFTSLVVSIILTYDTEKREKDRLIAIRETLFSNLISICLKIYHDNVYKINHFIIHEDNPKVRNIYKLYEDFSPYNEFETWIKNEKINEIEDERKNRIEELLKVNVYQVQKLSAELSVLSKSQYLLQGLISEDEYRKLLGPLAVESYGKYVDNVDKYWEKRVIDYEACLKILRMTTYISSKIIGMFKDAILKIEYVEKEILEIINQEYYEDVYTQTDEYIEREIERQEDYAEYMTQNQEQFFEKEQTTEEEAFKKLQCRIEGFCAEDIKLIISKIDFEDENVINYLRKKEIRKKIAKDKELKHALKKLK